MSSRADFFQVLLREGRAVLSESSEGALGSDHPLLEVLRAAYADHGLDLAGPALTFEEPTALAAAHVVYEACAALVSHALPAAELENRMRMPGSPRTPAQHYSADLLLRYLPQIHRRARARHAADPLVHLVEKVLRQWPLSGVLADIEEGPTTPPKLGGHPGLMLLYAERLADHEKPAWFPSGQAREYVELVWTQLQKDMTSLKQADLPEAVPGVSRDA